MQIGSFSINGMGPMLIRYRNQYRNVFSHILVLAWVGQYQLEFEVCQE